VTLSPLDVPRVVNIRRDAGLVYEARCNNRYVYIGRGKDSVWGNPFTHIPTGTLAKFVVPYDQVLAEYEGYVRGRLDLMQRLGTLRGKVLGCFCRPRACHGDVLVRLFEEAFRNG
jgi:hypothetical protein